MSDSSLPYMALVVETWYVRVRYTLPATWGRTAGSHLYQTEEFGLTAVGRDPTCGGAVKRQRLTLELALLKNSDLHDRLYRRAP